MILDENMLEKYDTFMQTSKVYDCLPIIYPILGLNGEAGEAAEKVKKCLRDNKGEFDEETKNAIKKELADVLWYIWAAADDMNTGLDEIMSIGMQKVKERQETDTVHGNGDDREKKKESFIANTPTETPVQIEESIDDLPKRILAITTDVFDELKELYYKMKFINRSGKVDLTIVQHITKNNEVHHEVHTYKGKFKGIGRIDGAILIQLNNENDITEIIQILSENNTSNYYDFMINETTVSCPKVQELPLVYI